MGPDALWSNTCCTLRLFLRPGIKSERCWWILQWNVDKFCRRRNGNGRVALAGLRGAGGDSQMQSFWAVFLLVFALSCERSSQGMSEQPQPPWLVFSDAPRPRDDAEKVLHNTLLCLEALQQKAWWSTSQGWGEPTWSATSCSVLVTGISAPLSSLGSPYFNVMICCSLASHLALLNAGGCLCPILFHWVRNKQAANWAGNISAASFKQQVTLVG